MHLVAALRQLQPQLGGNHTAAAVGRVTGNADFHWGAVSHGPRRQSRPLPQIPGVTHDWMGIQRKRFSRASRRSSDSPEFYQTMNCHPERGLQSESRDLLFVAVSERCLGRKAPSLAQRFTVCCVRRSMMNNPALFFEILEAITQRRNAMLRYKIKKGC